MNPETLRKAVELADGFALSVSKRRGKLGSLRVAGVGLYRFDGIPGLILDALAAQLVRQVDAVGTDIEYTDARRIANAMLAPENRTEKTINACVEFLTKAAGGYYCQT